MFKFFIERQAKSFFDWISCKGERFECAYILIFENDKRVKLTLVNNKVLCHLVDCDCLHFIGCVPFYDWKIDWMLGYLIYFFHHTLVMLPKKHRVQIRLRFLRFKQKLVHYYGLLGPVGGPNVFWMNMRYWGVLY